MRSAIRFAVWTLVLSAAGRAFAAAEGPLATPEEGESGFATPELKAFALATLRQYAAQMFSERSKILDLKYIAPDEAGSQSGWGVNYKWNPSKASSRLGPDAHNDFVLSNLTYDLAVEGSYAFSDATNNEELSTVKAAARLERGNFGRLNVQQTVGMAFQQCVLEIPPATANAGERRERDRQLEKCIVDNGVDALVSKETGTWYYWLDFHGGLEGNQDYSHTRSLFGSSAAYAYQPSRNSARFNVFDLPFKLLRDAFSESSKNASGYTAPFPSARISLERLDAKSDEVRSALTSKNMFTRASAEVAFNTTVASIDQKVVRFNVSYRYFRELSAPQAVRAADLDSFDYVRASLRFPAQLLPFIESDSYEIFVAYTSGRLPFDQEADNAYEIGISTNIRWLGDLLSR